MLPAELFLQSVTENNGLSVFLYIKVSELVKLPALAKPKVVLAITDLTLPLGRRVAAKAISAL